MGGAEKNDPLISTVSGQWKSEDGRGERIRTSGPCLPKTVLYQAELLPDRAPGRKRPVQGEGPPSGRLRDTQAEASVAENF